MKILFPFTLFLILQLNCIAQETLSLIECVRIAIENSLEIDQAQSDLQNAEVDFEQSKLELYPNLNANTQHGLNFGRSLDFTTYDFNTETTQSNSFGVNTSATLFNGGRIRETIKLQEMLANRNETNIQAIKDQVAITVAANYLMAISAKEQIKTAENLVELRQEDVDRTKKLIDAGVAAGSELYEMEAQLSNAEFQLIQATNNYETAILQLKQSMLFPFDQKLNIEVPDIPTPDILEVRTELSPDIVFENALVKQGSIIGANQDIEIATQNIKLAEAQKYPTISIGGGINSYHSSVGTQIMGFETLEQRIPVEGIDIPNQNPYIGFINTVPIQENANFFDQIGDNLSQNLGLSIQIPIFNRGQINAQIEKAQNNVKRAKTTSAIQKRQLEQQIESAFLDAELAYKALEAAKIQVVALEKSAEFAQKRYEIGAATIYDYFTTQNALANAKIEYTNAKYDYIYKVKVLEFYKENNFEF